MTEYSHKMNSDEKMQYLRKVRIEMKKSLKQQVDENSVLREKCDNLTELQAQDIEIIEQLRQEIEVQALEIQSLNKALEQKQCTLDCHQNELDELRL